MPFLCRLLHYSILYYILNSKVSYCNAYTYLWFCSFSPKLKSTKCTCTDVSNYEHRLIFFAAIDPTAPWIALLAVIYSERGVVLHLIIIASIFNVIKSKLNQSSFLRGSKQGVWPTCYMHYCVICFFFRCRNERNRHGCASSGVCSLNSTILICSIEYVVCCFIIMFFIFVTWNMLIIADRYILLEKRIYFFVFSIL